MYDSHVIVSTLFSRQIAIMPPLSPTGPLMINSQSFTLGASLDAALAAAQKEWREKDNVRRLWARDAGLWTGKDESKWLAWLSIAAQERGDVASLVAFADEVKARGFRHVLVLGMGGSSLGPEVIARTIAVGPDRPQLLIVDSTDPAQVRETENAIDLRRTLFIVASKSGSTLEPNVLKDYFFARAEEALGAKAASHFVAVTDPGSSLEHAARADGFWKVFHGVPEIGGRYSVLSRFGLVPAAARGVDIKAFLEDADRMAEACGPDTPPEENPGLQLGLAIGAAARHGRDKLTLMASPAIASFGAWVEQLVAESTGKRGKAIIPVDEEPLAAPALYGRDRLFVHLRLAGDARFDGDIGALKAAGHPVITIEWQSPAALAQEFFRFEFATAVAGAVLGINPFDQPDVEAAKVRARELTAAYQKTGSLPSSAPLCVDGVFSLFGDEANGKVLRAGAADLQSILRAHLHRIKPDDYFALLAYLSRNSANEAALQRARRAVRDRFRVATTIGFGPRFLHSTGQAHKGGPNSGLFLEITATPDEDLAIPGNALSFGVVEMTQAIGDFDVLAGAGRRILRVHIARDVERNLARLADLIVAACQP
jgi:transaldolase/glucose-6-phosphate isomerase